MDSDIQDVITFGEEERENTLNLLNPNSLLFSSSYYTLTQNNGLFTLVSNGSGSVAFGNFEAIYLEQGKTYTISKQNATYDTDGIGLYFEENGTRYYSQFTPSTSRYYTLYLRIELSYSEPITFNIMVNEGSTALPYEPYNANKHIENAAVALLNDEWKKTSNIVGLVSQDIAISGNEASVVSKTENGIVINIIASSSSTSGAYFPILNFEIGKTYTISFDVSSTETINKANIGLDTSSEQITVGSTTASLTKTVTVSSDKTVILYFNTTSGAVVTIYNLMINEGSTALPYQPYTGEILHTNSELLMENIVDKNGHNRFIEGAGEVLPSLTGVTFTYNKWSLSGSHLMFVVCGDVDNGTTIPHDYMMGNFLLPQWIIDKIHPTFGTVGLETKSFNLYGTDFTNEPIELNEIVNAEQRKVQFFVKGATTTTANRSFRIQFDLLIDNE